MTALRIVPVSFADACGFVATWHRHHQPPIGHKFSLGVVAPDDKLVGVAIVGRPVARHLDDGMTLEVNRTATALMAYNAPAPVNPVGVYGKTHDGRRLFTRTDGSEQRAAASLEEAQQAMGTPWMTDFRDIAESIPPAYTEYLGGQLIDQLEDVAA